MRRIAASASVLACLVLLGAAAAWTPQPQPSYAIVCRGGPGLEIELKAWDFQVVNYGAMLFLHFQRGSGGATAHGVTAGTCAWQDRAVSAGEPASLCWDGVQWASVRGDVGRGTLGTYGVTTLPGESMAAFANADRIVSTDTHWVNPGDTNVVMYFRARNEQVRGTQCLHVVHTGT
jgi:hypothetical protein